MCGQHTSAEGLSRSSSVAVQLAAPTGLIDFVGCSGIFLAGTVQVAFFLPQLVQQLRGDEGGLIRHALPIADAS